MVGGIAGEQQHLLVSLVALALYSQRIAADCTSNCCKCTATNAAAAGYQSQVSVLGLPLQLSLEEVSLAAAAGDDYVDPSAASPATLI